jgi:CRP-like cAMP-binding protein
MDLKEVLQSIDVFEGLTDEDLDRVTRICSEKNFRKGEYITREGETGDEMYVITGGSVDVMLGESYRTVPRVVVSLGAGQIIGEMALLDQGPRSASVMATSEPTTVQVIQRQEFEDLCEQNTRIGYLVMRNLAVDLSFKLRHRNLGDRTTFGRDTSGEDAPGTS